MKRRHYVIGAVLVVVTVAAVLGIAYISRKEQVIPRQIREQAQFALFAPATEGDSQLRADSVKFDAQLGLFSAIGEFDGVGYVISQQATPVQFTEIPQYYEKLRDAMEQYGSFESVNGTVYLTRPKELQGKQAAVLSEKGTLISVKPDKDFTEDQWRKFFNTLELLR